MHPLYPYSSDVGQKMHPFIFTDYTSRLPGLLYWMQPTQEHSENMHLMRAPRNADLLPTNRNCALMEFE